MHVFCNYQDEKRATDEEGDDADLLNHPWDTGVVEGPYYSDRVMPWLSKRARRNMRQREMMKRQVK